MKSLISFEGNSSRVECTPFHRRKEDYYDGKALNLGGYHNDTRTIAQTNFKTNY